MCQGVVSSDLLNEFAIAWGTGISHDDEIEWTLLASVTLESDFDSHKKLKFLVGG
jgi:hypothetical protein